MTSCFWPGLANGLLNRRLLQLSLFILVGGMLTDNPLYKTTSLPQVDNWMR
jgi:hypothetical protein